MIQVTAAIIQRDGKLLICQRPIGKHCELLWEFPGGKIESGETPEECLIRECREELDCTVEIEQAVQEIKYEYSDITVNVHFYLCKLLDGEPSCIEHNDIKWHTLDEIAELTLCPADKILLNFVAYKIRETIG